uniref:Putative host-nuclease inhibitor protein n=1 Tax=viral metagenome TaxID=1070528 RepID=A0A6M3LDC7_9ZZZZ
MELGTEADDDYDISEDGIDLALAHHIAPVTPEVEAQAVRYLRAYKAHQADADATAAAYKAEIQRLKDKAQEEAERAERRTAFLAQALEGYYRATGARRIVLPYGTLSERKQPAHVIVEDEALFCSTHAGGPLVQVKASPDKKAIMDAVKKTGDIPEGADIDTPAPKFIITTT